MTYSSEADRIDRGGRQISIERDTPMLYDTAGGTQAVEAQTQTHSKMCN